VVIVFALLALAAIAMNSGRDGMLYQWLRSMHGG
jgi:hypothetical protein